MHEGSVIREDIEVDLNLLEQIKVPNVVVRTVHHLFANFPIK